MSDLIYGINPLTISRATWKGGRRWGAHPYKDVLYKRKKPILYALFGPYQQLFDGWYSAEVCILGADGDPLKYIKCRSDAEAKRICNEINQQLNNFVASIKRGENN